MFTSIVWILGLQKAEEPERLETEDRRHLLQVSGTFPGLEAQQERLVWAALSRFLALSRSFSCGQTRLYDLDFSGQSAHVSPRLDALCWPTPGSSGSGLDPLK